MIRPIPCEECETPAVVLAEHPDRDKAPRLLPPLYLCENHWATYRAYFEVEGVRVRRLVILAGN